MGHPIFRKNGKTVATICSWIRRRLVGYLKTNEANSEKFVYLSFSRDHFGRPEMLNVINVDLSGFSKGIAALDTACAAPR